MDDPRDLSAPVTHDHAELSKRCRQLLDTSQDALDQATRLSAGGESEAALIAMDEASASLAILADLTDAFERSVQADESAAQGPDSRPPRLH